MYCVVVLHISYDNRLRTARYEVTTQRHVGIAAQRWSEHRMESRRRRHAVSGSAVFKKPIAFTLKSHFVFPSGKHPNSSDLFNFNKPGSWQDLQ